MLRPVGCLRRVRGCVVVFVVSRSLLLACVCLLSNQLFHGALPLLAHIVLPSSLRHVALLPAPNHIALPPVTPHRTTTRFPSTSHSYPDFESSPRLRLPARHPPSGALPALRRRLPEPLIPRMSCGLEADNRQPMPHVLCTRMATGLVLAPVSPSWSHIFPRETWWQPLVVHLCRDADMCTPSVASICPNCDVWAFLMLMRSPTLG